MRGSGGSTPSVDRERLRDERELHALAAADDRQAREEERVRVEGHGPIVMPGIATVYPASPRTTRTRPGRRKSRRGVHIRKKRSVRQPSRNVFRCGGWLLRPSGCRVIGTSLICAPERLALMIISVANSIPVHRWSSCLIERLREAAHAAVDVVDGRAEPAARNPREHRDCRTSDAARHGAGQHASAARLEPAALHEVVPFAKALDELRQLAEVVAVVRVAHDDEPPARGVDAAHQGGAVAAIGDRNEPRAFGPVAIAGESSVLPLSATTTSPAIRRLLHRGQRLPDARRERVRLVEAGHHDREFERCVSWRAMGCERNPRLHFGSRVPLR